MKKIVMLALSLVSMVLYSQVVIGNSAQPQLSSPSVSLEFTTPGGLVLPYVSESAADSNGASEGTLVMDPITNKVKLKVDTGWLDLSNAAAVTNTIDLTQQNLKTEYPDARVIIGKDGFTNATKGVLVLSDNDKAMVLPKIDSPHLNIINPAPGMIVYDSFDKHLAIFNGTQWSFWK